MISRLAILESRRVESAVAYDKKERCFVDAKTRNVRYKGAIPSAMRAYYPDNSPLRSKKGKTKGSKKQAAASNTGGVSGIALGKRVDRELCTVMKDLHESEQSLASYLMKVSPGGLNARKVNSKTEKKVIFKSAKSRSENGKKVIFESAKVRSGAVGPVQVPLKKRKLHARTLSILRAVAAAGWIPLACQVPVSSKETKRATMVDMVCYSPATKKYVVVETKSGYVFGYKTSSGKLSAPFTRVADTFLNRHFLQLLVTTVLFRHTFNLSAESVESVVMRVDNNKVDRIELPVWATKGTSDAWARFVSGEKKPSAASEALAKKEH